MRRLYETKISNARWIAYDLPGNIGWIAYIVALILCFAKSPAFMSKGVLRGLRPWKNNSSIFCYKTKALKQIRQSSNTFHQRFIATYYGFQDVIVRSILPCKSFILYPQIECSSVFTI